MKRLLSIVWISLLAVLASGCVDVDVTMKIKLDQSSEVSGKVLVDEAWGENLTSLLSQEMQKTLKDEGVKVADIKEEGKVGLSFQKDLVFGEINKEIKDSKVEGMNQVEDAVDFSVEKGFLFNTYKVTGDWDLMNLLTPSQQLMAKLMGESVNLRVNFIIPFEAAGNNADLAEKVEDGYKYSWNLKVNEEEQLILELKAPNLKNMGLLAGGILILTGAGVYIYRRKK